MKSILITDCLQLDFVGHIGRFDPLPNSLHVGHDESRRLLGDDPREGPVARTLAWAHAQPSEQLTVVHVRDWHDPSDDVQREHLARFGPHCLRGSAGAEFVFSTDGVPPDRFTVVNATTLSNFLGGGLGPMLEACIDGPARIGIMGVWTEAKITFLAYELRVRFPTCELAVCPALTASSSRQNHYVALDQMERILGVSVLPAVGDFIAFLGGQVSDAPLLGFSERYPELELEGAAELGSADLALLRYLFRGCRKVRARSLDGGFSGNAVLGTTSVDLHGHEQVPHVVKIGDSGPIAKERTAFERIEAVLGNGAPRVTDFADLKGRGAIKYRYAAMGGGQSRSFQKLYESGEATQEIRRVLDSVFEEQLGRFYRAARAERCDLLDYYGFNPKWAGAVRANVAEIAGAQGQGATLELPFGRSVTNVAEFYAATLSSLPRTHRSHHFAQVHGDLNGANIIVDARGNVWLIDFFHSHFGHVLRDLAKLENDVLYIFTKLESDAELEHAFELTDQLLAVEDLGRAPRFEPAASWSPALQRACETLQHLRQFYPELVQADRDAGQLLIAQLRYAVHTLSFVESSARQKLWALYTASRAASELEQRARREGELRVDWLPEATTAPGRLGLTLLPGRRDRGRDLARDLAALRAEQVAAMVCLLSPEEFRRYGVDELLTEYRSSGFDVYHQPILDGAVPSPLELGRTVSHVIGLLAAGKRVVVHCVGGLGRAGTIAACVLSARGLSGALAIEQVRTSRSRRAIETDLQEQTILAYQHTP